MRVADLQEDAAYKSLTIERILLTIASLCVAVISPPYGR